MYSRKVLAVRAINAIIFRMAPKPKPAKPKATTVKGPVSKKPTVAKAAPGKCN